MHPTQPQWKLLSPYVSMMQYLLMRRNWFEVNACCYFDYENVLTTAGVGQSVQIDGPVMF
eukprot:scaffold45250_cov19-Prasinocladus_malaysianus.AAC.1